MNILIAMDIEGVAGVWRPEQTQAGHAEYEKARRWMTEEATAAVRGAFAGGATAVWVNDSHGHYGNLLPDLLDPRALLIQGKPRQLGMMAGLENGIDGVCLVGWHAHAKSAGVLAHTCNGFAFARVWLNAQEIGEIGLYTQLAAEYKTPVIMASGCDIAMQEAALHCPHSLHAIVKWSSGARSACTLSPEAARQNIEQTVKKAVQALQQSTSSNIVPTLTLPLTLRIQCQSVALADVLALWPSIERQDADTLQIRCDSVLDAVRSLNALSMMTIALR